MSETEEHKIRDYLLYKELPIDILLEVNDHFMSQISDLEREENLSFEEAFKKTKENWKKDLTFSKPFYKIGNAGIPTTNFERNLVRNANYNTLKISLLICAPLTLTVFLLSFLGNYDTFKYLLKLFLVTSLFFGFGFILFAVIYQYYLLRNKLKDFKISVYQWRIFVINSFGYFMLVYLKPIDFWATEIFVHRFSLLVVMKILIYFILIFSYVYTGINQIKFLQVLRKLKSNLKFT